MKQEGVAKKFSIGVDERLRMNSRDGNENWEALKEAMVGGANDTIGTVDRRKPKCHSG